MSERTCSKWVNATVEGGNLHAAVKAHHHNSLAHNNPQGARACFRGRRGVPFQVTDTTATDENRV